MRWGDRISGVDDAFGRDLLEVVELSDNHFALCMADAGYQTQIIENSTATTISGASVYAGMIVTGAVALATVSVYDALDTTSGLLETLSIASTGRHIMPFPIRVANGLTVKVSALGGRVVVLYR